MRRRAPGVVLVAAVGITLLLGACGGGETVTVEAPWPTPTAAAHPVTPIEIHCFTCHGPTGAAFFPISSASTDEPMPHPLEQRQDCLICHATRAPFPFSESHDLALNQACLICHTPGAIQ